MFVGEDNGQVESTGTKRVTAKSAILFFDIGPITR